ncbi:MAG TPA: 3-hydroxyacyl-CoA dehydrogenase, partial [Desulfobacterales bacterium]|nr:3-hydroxyacyl-CoA dehydrogenase [Desulfobacterales bacterium]
MGSGIVNPLLKEGFEVMLWDINDAAIEKGVASVRETFAYPIKKKKMTPADLDDLIKNKLTTTTALKDLKDVDLVIEAVLEDMKIKMDIWKQLEVICRPAAIFATNT